MTERLRAALAEVSEAATAFLAATTDYDQLIDTIARSIGNALKATCSLSLVSEDMKTTVPIAVYDPDPEVRARFTPFIGKHRPTDSPLTQAMLRSGGVFIPDVDLDAYRTQLPTDTFSTLRALGVHSIIGTALRVRDEPIGVVSVMRHKPPPFDDLERELVDRFASFAGLALTNARLHRRTRYADAALFLEAVIENIPDMVFVKDADRLAFVRFNRAGEQLLGFPREALIGRNDFDFFPKDEAEFFVAKDRETLRNKQLVDIAEEPIQTATGQRWLHTKKVPIVDADGTPRYLLGISEDITDRKREVAELRAAKDAAEAANKELESFSYSVAHDLRTPLRSIDGFTQALLEDCSDQLGEVGRSYCVRVRNAAQRMALLIDDLLKLSRVTRTELRCSPVDLAELFRGALATLQRLEPERPVTIETSGDLTAAGDPKLLAIVFDNLCGNAWKFTSKRPDARVELGTQDIDGKRVYFVRDNGVGFDMTYAQKLFGVFQRFHPEVEFPGTGVGLATVQRIITRHNGRIWAEAAVDHGATFLFTLGELGAG